MELTFDANKPIYAQIIDAFKRQLASGVIPPGGRIESVRELALQSGVNPNTMQRALTELEREGLLYAERTSGRFATRDEERLSALRADLTRAVVEAYINAMGAMGLDKDAAVRAAQEFSERSGTDGSVEG